MQNAIVGARLFDGESFHQGAALVLEGDRIAALVREADLPPDMSRQTLGGTIAPGFVDLQVNGGGGRMVDGSTDLAFLTDLCALHRSLGTAGILPTLITDTPAATAAVIAAGIAAARAQVPGFLGLHLEGPHLDPRRKGAHDPALIRPMTGEDLNRDGAVAPAPRKTFRQAATQIIVADVSMSLDNVLAVAGAAREHPTVLVIGLVLSIALMGLAASFIARLLGKHRWIAYVGLAIILYVALKMIWEGWHQVEPLVTSAIGG